MDAGTIIAGRFEIAGQAGRGGMASVHRAIDLETSDYVAIKLLHVSMEDVGDRFKREAEVLAQLRHPGIVGYVAHGEMDDGRAFLAMRWVEGETLTSRIRRLGRLDQLDVLELGANVADALAAAHAAGIVHRDVKPSNLLLASDGFDRPVIVDFGIARVGQAASAMTQEGMLIGTPGYISPEQARGSLKIDPRADQFALACVLHAALTGKPPFRGEDLVGVLAKILFQETPRVRAERGDVAHEVDAILAKAMEKEPDDRFEDATAMARALRKARAQLAGDRITSAPSLVVAHTPHSTPGISAREARLSAMVFVERTHDAPPVRDATFIGKRFGGDAERLANGAIALRFVEAASATERALAAARCALALRARLPDAAISLATVRGTGGDDDVVRAIDRAAELVREGPRSTRTMGEPVRIDETTAGLLDARFDVRRTDVGLELVAESGTGDESRTIGTGAPCIGRDRELLTLDATLEEVLGEHVARAIVVIAEAGIGKSRLRREWLHRVRERLQDGVATWVARADPLDSRAPHGLLGQALRRTLGIADDAPPSTKQARLHDHLSQLLDAEGVARVFPFACEIASAPLSDTTSTELVAARADRALMAARIKGAFEEWIVAECKRRPLIVVLDDAHWSDAATLRLLDAALGAAADAPLLVAVFARPPLRATHAHLFADRRVQDLRLEELSKRSADRVARAMLGPAVPQSTIDRVVALANGNAFFLEELARAVLEGKVGALPDSVLSVVEARLEALEPDARRVLRAASVFGQFFWPGGVAAVLGDTDEEAASAWIASLVRREIVAPRAQSRFEGEPELTFRHVLVRDSAYSMLTPEDRAVAHRAAASWLEARGEAEPAVLAAHLDAGGEVSRAARYYLRAAEQMLAAGAPEDARDLAHRGLSCGPNDATRAELLLLQASAFQWIGDLEKAAHSAEGAMEFSRAGDATHTRALATALLTHLKLGHGERHGELLPGAKEFLEVAEPDSAVCRLASVIGTGAIFSGDVVTARAIDPIVSRLIQSPKIDAAARASLHTFRAFFSDAQGNLEAQVHHFDAASEYFSQAGDVRSKLLHRANAGFARTLIGDYEQAATLLERTLADAERARIQMVIDTALADLASTYERMTRYEESRACATRAVAGFQIEGDQRMEAASRGYLALALFRLGDRAHAFTEMHAALAIARTTSRQIVPWMLAVLSSMELDVGNAQGAIDRAREADVEMRWTRSDGSHEMFVHVALARALSAIGLVEEANGVLGEAYAVLTKRMTLIRDARLRACFAAIEENAAVLAWHARAQ